jgi:hypothetical protein
MHSTTEALVVLLDRFRGEDESGLKFPPNRANHECLATIVAQVLESVQQGCRERTPETLSYGKYPIALPDLI